MLALPLVQLTGTPRAGTHCIEQPGLQHLVILFKARELCLCYAVPGSMQALR